MTKINMLINILSDILSYTVCIILSFLFYEIYFTYALTQVRWELIFGGCILFLTSVYNYGGYKSHDEFSLLQVTTALIRSGFTTVIISIVILFILNIEIPSFITVESRVAFIIGIIIIPSIIRYYITSIFIQNHNVKDNILIVGAGAIGRTFLEQLNKTDHDRFNIIGLIDDRVDKGEKIVGYKVIGKISDISSIINNNKIDRVILAIRNISNDKLNQIHSKLIDKSIKIYILPSINSFINNPSKLKQYSGIPLISTGLKEPTAFYQISKRIIDIIGSIIGLFISIPLLPIIIMFIFFDSKGSLIFKQTRIGLDGKEFEIYKFRTMYSDSKKYDHCPTDAADNRVTRIGRWLRKTSLDELPQFINILKGQMSLVGPRPEMPFQVQGYTSFEKQRWSVKPGLTGLWQITPHRNSEPCENPEYDNFYILNQSLTLDIVIILLTGIFIFRTWTH